MDPHSAHARGQDALLADLTAPQKEAVLCTRGPLLILAAAGSGKTRVITRRIAHLLRSGVPPWSILALTFTNKAAGEMRERVAHLITAGVPREDGSVYIASDRAAKALTVTTFHSLCARLLRRYAEAAGLRPDYTIFDDGDQMSLAKKVIADLQLSTSNWPPRSVLSAISNAKNDLLDAAAYEERATDFHARTVAKVYKAYEAALKKANAVDFDDLLGHVAKMLKTRPDVRAELQDRWRYLMIDEYQDTNRAQFTIAHLLAGDGSASAQPGTANTGPNVCVVGDPDQSIYGWRGADLSNILDFEKHYPKARTIKLGENFRSTAPILRAADGLIKHNKERRDKPLFTSKAGGEPIEIVLTRDERHEASLVADWLRARHMAEDNGEAFAWKDLAVFYRTNSLSRVMEDALRQAGIPYVIARGTAFYDREEVKAALAYLRVVANPADAISLERCVNTPSRGISDPTIDKLNEWAGQNDATLWDAMLQAGDTGGPAAASGLSSRAVGSIQKFVELVEGWTGGGTFMGAQVSSSLSQLVERIIVESGLRAMYSTRAATSKSDADAARLDNLDELISSARAFELEYDPAGDPAAERLKDEDAGPGETGAADAAFDLEPGAFETPPLLAMLRGFLESITLIADADAVDPAQGAVTLMTLHAAKGLEFGAAAIIALEEGTLPHSRALTDESQMEEERRLCFVGITRAMKRLMLTCARYRTQRGLSERTMPSRFIDEIPSEARVLSDQADMFGGLDASWGGARDSSDLRGDDFGDRLPRPAPRTTPTYPVHPSSPGSALRPAAAKPGSPPSPSAPSVRRVVPTDDPASSGNPGLANLPAGAVVRHPQFGRGKVMSVSKGQNARAVINFDGVGVKTLVLEYARLTRVT
ncbi:MAG: UvrD-helicase domain-containing protein [Tepidisphaera sp.]